MSGFACVSVHAFIINQVKTAIKIAERVGPHSLHMVSALFKGSQPLRYLRRVQGILILRNIVSTEALEFA